MLEMPLMVQLGQQEPIVEFASYIDSADLHRVS